MTFDNIGMELRAVDTDDRVIVGRAAPYGVTSLLVGDPSGERLMAGAFRRSISQRGDVIPLLVNHDRERTLGRSTRFDDDDDELVGRFRVNDGADGDRLLDDLRNGYYGGLSVGFRTIDAGRGDDGVREIREAALVEVSVVGIPAYEGAQLLAVRSAQSLADMLAPFDNRPVVNLDPLPPIVWQR